MEIMIGKWISPGSDTARTCPEVRVVLSQDAVNASTMGVDTMKRSTIALKTFGRSRTRYTVALVTEADVARWVAGWKTRGSVWNGANLTAPTDLNAEMRGRFPGLLVALGAFSRVWTPSEPQGFELTPPTVEPPKRLRTDQDALAREANHIAREQLRELRQIRGLLAKLTQPSWSAPPSSGKNATTKVMAEQARGNGIPVQGWDASPLDQR